MPCSAVATETELGAEALAAIPPTAGALLAMAPAANKPGGIVVHVGADDPSKSMGERRLTPINRRLRCGVAEPLSLPCVVRGCGVYIHTHTRTHARTCTRDDATCSDRHCAVSMAGHLMIDNTARVYLSGNALIRKHRRLSLPLEAFKVAAGTGRDYGTARADVTARDSVSGATTARRARRSSAAASMMSTPRVPAVSTAQRRDSGTSALHRSSVVSATHRRDSGTSAPHRSSVVSASAGNRRSSSVSVAGVAAGVGGDGGSGPGSGTATVVGAGTVSGDTSGRNTPARSARARDSTGSATRDTDIVPADGGVVESKTVEPGDVDGIGDGDKGSDDVGSDGEASDAAGSGGDGDGDSTNRTDRTLGRGVDVTEEERYLISIADDLEVRPR